jgi:hypothetical protein
MSFWDTVFNVGTGGITNAVGATNDTSDVRAVTGAFDPVSPFIEAGGQWAKGGDFWQGLDRMLDLPGGEKGGVDYLTRMLGDQMPDSVRQYGTELGTTIGGVVGSYVPVIGTAAGAAIGSGIGSKIKGGTTNKTYGQDFLSSGLAYIGGKAAGMLSSGEAAAGAGAGDALAGGLTTEELAMLGPEYFAPAAADVGADASTGLVELGQAESTYQIPSTEPLAQPQQLSGSTNEPDMLDKTWDFMKNNSGKMVDAAKMLMSSPEEDPLSAYQPDSGYMAPVGEEEMAMMRRLSGEGPSKASKASNLFGLDMQKKPKSYDMSALLRELANYNKDKGGFSV